MLKLIVEQQAMSPKWCWRIEKRGRVVAQSAKSFASRGGAVDALHAIVVDMRGDAWEWQFSKPVKRVRKHSDGK